MWVGYGPTILEPLEWLGFEKKASFIYISLKIRNLSTYFRYRYNFFLVVCVYF